VIDSGERLLESAGMNMISVFAALTRMPWTFITHPNLPAYVLAPQDHVASRQGHSRTYRNRTSLTNVSKQGKGAPPMSIVMMPHSPIQQPF
jgi:hypothetical protein